MARHSDPRLRRTAGRPDPRLRDAAKPIHPRLRATDEQRPAHLDREAGRRVPPRAALRPPHRGRPHAPPLLRRAPQTVDRPHRLDESQAQGPRVVAKIKEGERVNRNRNGFVRDLPRWSQFLDKNAPGASILLLQMRRVLHQKRDAYQLIPRGGVKILQFWDDRLYAMIQAIDLVWTFPTLLSAPANIVAAAASTGVALAQAHRVEPSKHAPPQLWPAHFRAHDIRAQPMEPARPRDPHLPRRIALRPAPGRADAARQQPRRGLPAARPRRRRRRLRRRADAALRQALLLREQGRRGPQGKGGQGTKAEDAGCAGGGPAAAAGAATGRELGGWRCCVDGGGGVAW
uniref:Uncharacterized protein n=1 Tax=Phyllosticta citricarpa TaxID=55181 RepID=A0A140CWM1_9PEZI|nr:hypothetical protein [Phyllosticta citricarpa]